jgi:hypothetical protein
MAKHKLTEHELAIAREQSFWVWFWENGLRRFLDRWLPLHMVLGVALAFALDQRLSDVAKAALLPVAAILVALAFAWSGSIVGILQTTQLQRVTQEDGGKSLRNIAFTFQMAILVILITIVIWSLLAAGLVDGLPWWRITALRYLGRSAVFTLSSITVRECWQVTLFVQHGLITLMQVTRAEQNQEQGGAPAQPTPAQLGQGPTTASGSLTHEEEAVKHRSAKTIR